jgi:iron complex outermembrane recepter protein
MSSLLSSSVLKFSLVNIFAVSSLTLASPNAHAEQPEQENTAHLDRAKDLLRQAAGNIQDLQPVTISQAGPANTDELLDDSFLDEVVVTATRRPTRQGDNTAVTYTITREDFKRLGARTVADALQLVPGYESPPSLGGLDNYRLSFLRGFDNSRFQLLRDGISLQRPDDGANDISRITVEDLERIEVVTGGATLRYGAGAVGGVINLITETPKGSPKVTLKYEAGSYGYSRYVAKYSGGDDTLSYNFLYAGLVAFNDFPFSLTIPNQAQFYGPTDFTTSGVPLFGLLKPEVGSPLTLSARANTAFNASDTYSGKVVLKPDPFNKISIRFGQQNSKSAVNGPGNYVVGVCRGGPDAAPNGTLAGTRSLPVDLSGNELPCDPQRYIFNTATTVFASRYAYNASFDSSRSFSTGQAYSVEDITGTNAFNARYFRTATDASARWDSQITPTTSLNSYISYFRNTVSVEVPTNPFAYNTNIFGTGAPGQVGGLPLPPVDQPFNITDKFEIQSAVNTQLSPGQIFSVGVNYLQEKVFQALSAGTTFLDQSISRTAFFVVDDISFSDQFKANLGFRYTYSTQFGSVGTPAIGLRYTPLPSLSFRANYSYVYNAPSISFLYVSGFPLIGNPSLRPEAGQTYDIGLDFEPARNVNIQLTYFSTYLDGVVGIRQFQNPDPVSAQLFPLLSQPQNLNSRYASGIELSGNWQVSKQIGLRLAWTNTDARDYGSVDTVSQSTFPNFYGYQEAGIPYNKVVAALTYSNSGFNTSFVLNFDSGKRRADAASGNRGATQFLPAWTTLDLNLEIPLSDNFAFTANIFNLTDTQYEYLPGVPAPGTTFRLGGRIEFGG